MEKDLRLIFNKKIFYTLVISAYVCINQRVIKIVELEKESLVGVGKDLIISAVLLEWYEGNKRDLPWRKSKDPYIIWVSEIILQQTRVAQGLDYFLRFTERFPNIASLAEAVEDDVLKMWQGLGYYSRARNLQAAARDIMSRFQGVFPSEYKDILSLKGIGEYTAAAIASFVWNQPYPVVDGNVYRVLSRLFALATPIDTTKGKKEFKELANLIMNQYEPGRYNQAIMEFGALQCVPQQPNCFTCPLSGQCVSYATNDVHLYPAKQNKIKTKDRFFNYLYIIYNGNTWLNKREGKDIWAGLYEFPLIETGQAMDFSQLQETEQFKQLFKGVGTLRVSVNIPEIKHVLSHQVLYARFFCIEIDIVSEALNSYLLVPVVDLENYAVSRLIQKALERM